MHIDRLGTCVVKLLMEPHFDRSYNITTDNFTSQNIAMKLLSRHTSVVGTVLMNRREIPVTRKLSTYDLVCYNSGRGIYTPAVGSQDMTAITASHSAGVLRKRVNCEIKARCKFATARWPSAMNANDPSVDSAWPRYACRARDSRTVLMCNFYEFMMAVITAAAHQNALSWQI